MNKNRSKDLNDNRTIAWSRAKEVQEELEVVYHSYHLIYNAMSKDDTVPLDKSSLAVVLLSLSLVVGDLNNPDLFNINKKGLSE